MPEGRLHRRLAAILAADVVGYSRMEGLAEPGGICISGNVHEHVGLSPDFEFVDLGAQSVKNIAESIRCYRRVLEPDPESATVTAAPAPRPDLAIDKPSIAVLPFDNMSGEAEQEYFSDGITEDIITALSRIRQLSVLARNTSFTYKGRSVDVQTVVRDLSVRYVLGAACARPVTGCASRPS